ncbi:MAG: hypothetical protein HOL66_11775 [Rhodospirillaceae bacterium]|jgi:hypothetical protein|nr:hypothetical protein [Rhodospirillaceae bacterium]MBT5244910.1 hypothetical protein [Rhodospirillaceae bacterium]MBT5562700.1 hypothetical protein [Rhodospirillaceae bacterium]MBT6242991.1 hypothetical protein [Rhodospirillaceae bacterium]MBT7136838.1 hypothetical protein [Rhodospirillaceae bacterium]
MMKTTTLALALTLGTAAITAGAANASGALSSAEFQDMLQNIQTRQAEQRASIKTQVPMTSVKSHADFHNMLEKIQMKQAKQRGEIKQLVSKTGGMTHAEFHSMLTNIKVSQAKQRAAIMNTVRSHN